MEQDGVELIDLKRMPLVFRFGVVNEGEPIYVGQPDVLANFIEETIARYSAFYPLLEALYWKVETRPVPEDMLALAELLCDASDLPVLIQPNAGQPEVQGDSVIYRTTPDEFVDGIRRILETGAAAVGGCCGTDPETIRALRGMIDSRGT